MCSTTTAIATHLLSPAAAAAAAAAVDYGSFFLSWYSSCLLHHGDRLLRLANQVFEPFRCVWGWGGGGGVEQPLGVGSEGG